MTMYTNPTRAGGARQNKIIQIIVTLVVTLMIAGYHFGGIETVLQIATSVRYMFVHNPELEQGKQLLKIQDWHGALVAFDQAIAREPDNFAAYNGRAEAELVLGMEQEGLDDLKKSIAIQPNAAAYLLRSGYLYWAHLEDRGEADANMALKLEPDNFDALINHLFVYQKEGPEYGDEEIANYSRAIELFPKARKTMSKERVSDLIYSLYAGRAKRLMFQQRYQEAIDDYNQIFDLGSDNAFMLIMKVSEFKALMRQLAPDSAEYKGFAKLILRIEATGAVIR